jgi:microsomal epoxide hydrolase
MANRPTAIPTACIVVAGLWASLSGASEPTPEPRDVRPFTLHVADRVLADLRNRLTNARWPDQGPGSGWEYGGDIQKLFELAAYWQSFDWRTQEARINRYEQFVTTIDGQQIHFLRLRSSRNDAIPLMMIHGWPGSIVEFLGVGEQLANPEGRDVVSFDVVIPSLPGSGLSGPTATRGWDTQRIARAFVVLMDRLGYPRYGIQGGDWGSIIARQMAQQAPARVIGLHLNFLADEPPNPEARASMSEYERMRFTGWWERGTSSFFRMQSSEPQTVAYGLTDSPLGWLAWVAQIFQDVTDNDGDFLHAVDRDDFFANLTLYWVTGTVGSSMRIYREESLAGSALQLPPLSTPVGYAVFPKEVIAAPLRWLEQKYHIVQVTNMPRGGHFAALEQPDLLVQDVRKVFERILREKEGDVARRKGATEAR